MQKITTHLWFDDQAEEAAKYYVSLFKDSRVTDVARYPDPFSGEAGKVVVVSFQLAGQDLIALNGGPEFKFTEAISLYVDCEDQAEVDRLWDRFIADGGEESQCGWLKDRYGLSWQIVPRALTRLLGDKDPRKSERVMKAMLEMKKIDVPTLERAHEGRSAP